LTDVDQLALRRSMQLMRFPRHGVRDICTLVESDICHSTTRSQHHTCRNAVLWHRKLPVGDSKNMWTVSVVCLSRYKRCNAGTHQTCTHLHAVPCWPADTALAFDSIAGFLNVIRSLCKIIRLSQILFVN